ncbi:MAG: hypothetical protein ACOX5J_08475 [Candidatus Hydrogenedentales bacterium]|jgi:magnesium-transporting ATPase (P-type)
MPSPDESQSEPSVRQMRRPRRIALSGFLVLFWMTILIGAIVGLLEVWCNNEKDLLVGATSWEQMYFLFLLLYGLLFTLGGAYSAFRFGKGAKFGFYELLALAVVLLFGVLYLYVWIFL